jgi:hypothetical protein
MSKKSRRRNRRLLALAALAGGAALAGRGRGTAFPRPKEGTIDQMAANASKKVTGTEYPGVNKAVADHRFDTRFSKPKDEIISKGVRAQNLAANAAKNKAMNYQRSQTFDAKPLFGALSVPRINQAGSPIIRQYKKGGSVKKAKVTGIAKRGFGRALMKGRK